MTEARRKSARPASVPVKIAAFLAVLAIAFGGAMLLGRAIGPNEETANPAASGGHENGHDESAPGRDAAEGQVPGGLMVAQDGYRLVLERTRLAAGERTPVAFVVLGPDGRPVRTYARQHGKDLHLIAVRRDLTGFQHVHPALGSDGTWRTTLDTSTPGSYRLFADFRPAARATGLTLGADLAVPGAYDPAAFPASARTSVVDGYTVTLTGELVPGSSSPLRMSITTDGRPVTDLDPYLEAYGHLVVLRDGDLAYLHVHPAGSPGDGTTSPGPDVDFSATVPSAGRYRLFLDFSHGGVVRTAELTLTSTQSASPRPGAPGTTGSAPLATGDGHDSDGQDSNGQDNNGQDSDGHDSDGHAHEEADDHG